MINGIIKKGTHIYSFYRRIMSLDNVIIKAIANCYYIDKYFVKEVVFKFDVFQDVLIGLVVIVMNLMWFLFIIYCFIIFINTTVQESEKIFFYRNFLFVLKISICQNPLFIVLMQNFKMSSGSRFECNFVYSFCCRNIHMKFYITIIFLFIYPNTIYNYPHLRKHYFHPL